jgi:murein endopeptidase
MGPNTWIAALLLASSVVALAHGETPIPDRDARGPIEWRQSVAAGDPAAGRLIRGVLLPPEGPGWRSWDPIERSSPGRQWRRWGTDDLVRTVLEVIREFHRRHPNAPPILVGDLSRPRGGDFGPRYGFIGHATHQNGRDVDIYYPRTDRRPKPPDSPDQVDVRLAQDLVDLFVKAGPEVIFVGPSLPLSGPPGVVVPLVNHDNHLHFRIAG